jgi:hypothetical protein
MNFTPATGPSSSIFRFCAIDIERPGTLRFMSAAGRDAYLEAHPRAFAVEGSPASRRDAVIYR